MKNKALVVLAAVSALALGGVSAGCKKLEARDNLNKGVTAFKNAKYQEAVERFNKAIELDPSYPTARLYLATAYMSQYIPGAESPDNLALAKSAKDTFQQVLDTDPGNTTAIKSIASLCYSEAQGAPKLEDKLKRLDEAATWYQRLTKVDPNDKEAWYSLGVITWAKWYPKWMEGRSDAHMKADDPGPIKDKKVREQLKTEYASMIDTGISNLQKALDIDKEYDDAMAYMNLLIRERADLAEDVSTYKKETDTADVWMNKTLETRKIKAERQPKTTGIVAEGGGK